jgi:hypothetical protein
MAVPKGKRKLSEMEFFSNALHLAHDLTMYLLRNFGTKTKLRNTNLYASMLKMEKDDHEKFQEICDKYNITSIEEMYPEWLLKEFRSMVISDARMLIHYITSANTIYPSSISEFHLRREFQDKALGTCETMIQDLQYISGILDVDLNKYMPYVDMIEREIALLKGWRKSDNRLLRQVRRNEDDSFLRQHPELVASFEIYRVVRDAKARVKNINKEELNQLIDELIQAEQLQDQLYLRTDGHTPAEINAAIDRITKGRGRKKSKKATNDAITDNTIESDNTSSEDLKQKPPELTNNKTLTSIQNPSETKPKKGKKIRHRAPAPSIFEVKPVVENPT